jgi:opacity protein-like surface antigen
MKSLASVAVIAALLLTASAVAQSGQTIKESQLTSALAVKQVRALRSQMGDPDSLKVNSVFFVALRPAEPGPPIYGICIEFRGRNQMGDFGVLHWFYNESEQSPINSSPVVGQDSEGNVTSKPTPWSQGRGLRYGSRDLLRFWQRGNEKKFKDQMTADETCLAAYKVNLQKRVSGEPDACQDKSLPKAEDLGGDAVIKKARCTIAVQNADDLKVCDAMKVTK